MTNKTPLLLTGTFLRSNFYARCRWRPFQYMADLFWHKWAKEYLSLLQERQKWTAVKKDMNVGDIVMVVDPIAPRGSWPLGRVLESKPDARSLVRSVKIQIKTLVLVRPITKLCQILETGEGWLVFLMSYLKECNVYILFILIHNFLRTLSAYFPIVTAYLMASICICHWFYRVQLRAGV